MFYNDQEGKYLNRSRFYLVYAWHTHIFEETKLSLGLSAGAMNYSVKGTPLSGNGSDINPDAAVGIQVYRKSTWLGLSVNQLFNSEVQPLNEITVLAPYMNISGGSRFSLNNAIELIPTGSFRTSLTDISQQQYKNQLSLNLRMNLFNRLEPGLGLHNNEKLVINLALNNLYPAYGQIGINLSYAFLIRKNTTLDTPLFELGIIFHRDNKRIRF